MVNIPPQKPGSVVRYWFDIIMGSDTVHKLEFDETQRPYMFLVGFRTAMIDSVTNPDMQWTYGDFLDDAYNDVKWEFAVPEQSYLTTLFGKSIIQPAGNSRGEAKPCLVTGAKGTKSNRDIISTYPAGTVSMFSPEYTISQFKHPVFGFDYWFKSIQYDRDWFERVLSTFNIYISQDNGNNWENVHKAQSDTTNGWSNLLFDLKESGPKVQFKFVFRSGVIMVDNDVLSEIFNVGKALVDNIAIYDYDPNYTAVESDLPSGNASLQVSVSPSPADDEVGFSFNLTNPEEVKLQIYDLTGAQVAILKGSFNSGELSRIVWNRDCSDGTKAAPGTYVYKISANNASNSGKFVLNPD
jgi:hypothetical protein